MGKNLGYLYLLPAALILATLFSWPTLAQSLQDDEYNVAALVFEDLDANSLFDGPELQLGGWTIEIYDNSSVLLDGISSSATNVTWLSSSTIPALICIVEQPTWSQTIPQSGSVRPNSSWFCLDYDIENVETQYEFGVNLNQTEPEPIGQVIEEDDDTEAIEKLLPEPEVGVVLGENTDPEILANTGAPSWLVIAAGLTMLLVAIGISKKQLVEDQSDLLE